MNDYKHVSADLSNQYHYKNQRAENITKVCLFAFNTVVVICFKKLDVAVLNLSAINIVQAAMLCKE